MRTARILMLAAAIPILMAGCVTAYVPTSTNMTSLEDVDFTEIGSMRRGEACATTWLGLFTQGDAMTTTAAQEAGIRTIQVVEHKISANIIFTKQCAIVFGR